MRLTLRVRPTCDNLHNLSGTPGRATPPAEPPPARFPRRAGRQSISLGEEEDGGLLSAPHSLRRIPLALALRLVER
jgi:hypothetical protein